MECRSQDYSRSVMPELKLCWKWQEGCSREKTQKQLNNKCSLVKTQTGKQGVFRGRPARGSKNFQTPAADSHLDPCSGHLPLTASSRAAGSFLSLNLMEWLQESCSHQRRAKGERLGDRDKGHPAEFVIMKYLTQRWSKSASSWTEPWWTRSEGRSWNLRISFFFFNYMD